MFHPALQKLLRHRIELFVECAIFATIENVSFSLCFSYDNSQLGPVITRACAAASVWHLHCHPFPRVEMPVLDPQLHGFALGFCSVLNLEFDYALHAGEDKMAVSSACGGLCGLGIGVLRTWGHSLSMVASGGRCLV